MMVHFGIVLLVLLMICGLSVSTQVMNNNPDFDDTYKVTWGSDHVQNNGKRVQLYLDESSGAGFESKSSYGSGFFQMKIKVPGPNSAGVVTAYYLTSAGGNSDDHDELDFEFLGNKAGKPVTLQTNIYANGEGGREQRIRLWFDPTTELHTYQILWNQRHIVFYVDNIPIRYYRNLKKYGVNYPSKAMNIQVSVWNGDSWATDGGQTKINWTYAPFYAHFEDFTIYGCPLEYDRSIRPCISQDHDYWWNTKRYWNLDPHEWEEFEKVQRNYVTYDYCHDKSRHHAPPPECSHDKIVF